MLLEGGLKFDIRLYVLVSSISPLRVFACDEGLVRVCTAAYEQPTTRNSHKLAAHLVRPPVHFPVKAQRDYGLRSAFI